VPPIPSPTSPWQRAFEHQISANQRSSLRSLHSPDSLKQRPANILILVL
jgi:hypothetical protein